MQKNKIEIKNGEKIIKLKYKPFTVWKKASVLMYWHHHRHCHRDLFAYYTHIYLL